MFIKMSYKLFLKVIVLLSFDIGNALAEVENRNEQCTKTQTAFPPDPESTCCGQDGSENHKLLGGNQTYIDQYPWLVLLEYNKGTLCGGALISGRYVLTSAHCVTGRALSTVGPPKNARLGEYDTSNDGKDCVTDAGGEDCTDGAITIPIEEIIAHPEYKEKNHISYRNDIALVRLRETAPFTNFIRPICLPSADISADRPPYLPLIEAGWGSKPMHPIKLHQMLSLADKEACQKGLKAKTLDDTQLCAGAASHCRGNGGGPLMHVTQGTHEVVGVVSFGPRICGLNGLPTVYTSVFAYKDWIKSVIKA